MPISLPPVLGRMKKSAETAWFSRVPPKICDSVSEWAVARHIDVKDILPERKSTWKLPHTLEPSILPEYFTRLERIEPAKYLVELHEPLILGKFGAIILNDGGYSVESVFSRNILDEYVFPPRWHLQREFKKGNYFSLLNFLTRAHGYYHWLHDGLLRLYRVQEWLPKDIKYIVPPMLAPWEIEALNAMEISPHQLVSIPPHSKWVLENLFFCTWTTASPCQDVEANAWFRDRVLNYCGIQAANPKRRLFIDRSAMAHRRITNQADILHFLEPLGFELVAPEKLSFREQVELFSEAEIMIGPHGSAFTNVYFAPREMLLVDIVETSMYRWSPIFSHLTQSLGQDYWYLVADSVAREKGQPDMLVPIEKLQATLHEIGIA